MKDLKLESSCW